MKLSFIIKVLVIIKKITKEELDKFTEKKLDSTRKLLSAFNEVSEENRLELAIKYEDSIILKSYKNDYVAVNNIYVKPGVTIKKPVLNNLVLISERRAFEIQQIDYADRFNMFSELESNNLIQDYNNIAKEFFKEYEKLPNLYQKLKYLCEFEFSSEESKQSILNSITEKHFKEYYEILGPEKCRSLSYNVTNLNRRLDINTFDVDKLTQEIDKIFKPGDKYSKSNIKQILSDLYSSLNYKATPKASDLESYFDLKPIKLKDNQDKWVNGFEITKRNNHR